jgi:hypothetical protein
MQDREIKIPVGKSMILVSWMTPATYKRIKAM